MKGKDACLKIFLNRSLVGLLRRKAQGRGSKFEFSPTYLASPRRPLLSLGLLDAQGEPMPHARAYPGPRIDPFFSNMLPEGALRRYLSHQNGLKSQDEFLLLRALGADLPGAVQVTPTWVPSTGEDAWADLDDGWDPPAWCVKDADEEDDPFEGPPPNIRFSLSGVQLKHSLKRDASGRMTLPVHGDGGEFILKLPFAEWDGVPENEWSMLHLAKAAGFEVPDAELVRLNAIERLPGSRLLQYAPGISEDANGLIVRRFDRVGGGRIHMEDFTQVFRQWPDDKYIGQGFGSVCRAVHEFSGEDGALEVAKRLALHILIGNGDAHLKNWTVLHPQNTPSRLSPNYDLVCTLPYIPNEALALKLGGGKEFGMNPKRFQSMARHLPMEPDDLWHVATETSMKVQAAWRDNRLHYPVRDNVRTTLDQHIDAMARQADSAIAFAASQARVRPAQTEADVAPPDDETGLVR